MERTLTLRELNRATLARQMLLERAQLAAPAAVERLAGMQAQLASAPFVGLWTRLENFARADLADAITGRAVVKATLMRATLHLFSAADFVRFRTTLQPALDQAAAAIVKQRGAQIDVPALLDFARAFIADQPRTFAQISAALSEAFPGQDVGALRYTVRTQLTLVQVPGSGAWSYPGNPAFCLAQDWTGQAPDSEEHCDELILRYLAVFGPASAADMQTWSWLGGLKDAFERLRPGLVVYRDAKRRELLDAPGFEIPDGERAAPVRFLPEFDNLLLSHHDRTRILPQEYRSRIFLPGLRVRASILVDGFVRGAWKVEKTKKSAELVIEPFADLSSAERDELAEEARALVRFIEPAAGSHTIRFA